MAHGSTLWGARESRTIRGGVQGTGVGIRHHNAIEVAKRDVSNTGWPRRFAQLPHDARVLLTQEEELRRDCRLDCHRATSARSSYSRSIAVWLP